MSRNMKAVSGYDYLYERGTRFVVRVQIPDDVRGLIGKREFKKSVGGDLSVAKRKSHTVVAEFLAQIDAARVGAVQPVAAPILSGEQPTVEDIDAACYAHFKRMTVNMRGAVADPVGDNPRELRNRAEGFRVMIETHVAAHAYDAWGSMATDAEWLCEEHGWAIGAESALFELLCRTMLRARLQCYRDELRRLEGKMGVDPEADPMFGNQPPERKQPSLALGDLIVRFTAHRDEKWSASTRRNYIIINRVIEEVCGKETPLNQIDDEFCDNVRSVLRRLPANYQKHPATKGRPIPEVIEIAAAKGLPVISPATIN